MLAAIAAFLLLAVGSATSADTFQLRVVSQTSSTITLGWDPQPGYGYLFSADGQLLSRTNSASTSTVKFSKQYSTFEVAVIVKGATGTYPSATPPPPPKNQCEDTVDNDGDGKIDYPADPGCTAATDNDETDPVLPPPTGFPNASNTGVPAGTTLTAYTGPSEITTANTVITGKTITTCLTVSAPGVIIRSSRITCKDPAHGGDGFFAVFTRPDGPANASVLIEDSDISCGNTENTGVASWNTTVRRTSIHDCANGFSISQNVTIEDSYVHDLTCCTDNHTDGVQFDGGLWGIGSKNLTFRHNTIYGWDNNNQEGSNSSIISDSNAQNILVENNLFAGGTFTLYCSNGTTTGYVVRDNKFSTRFLPKVGMFGPVIGCSAENGGGNVYYETGLPVDMSPE